MGRAVKKGDATRARIIEEALHQASVKGYGAVSLNDVADAIGLSKSAVFKHFQSKEALQMALLETLIARFSELAWRPAEPLAHGRARLDVIFDRWLAWVEGSHWRGGCPIMVAAIELDDQPGPLREYLKGSLATWAAVVRREISALAEPPLSREEAEQAYFEFKSILFGYHQSQRLLNDPRAREHAHRAYDALCERWSRKAAA
jgi:AcrR family transcriptional regulator